MYYLNPNKSRAQLAILLIILVSIIELISLYSGFLQKNLLTDLNNGLNVTDEMLLKNDKREQMISYFFIAVYLISAITFIMWFRRAYNNLLQTNVSLKYSEGYAAGGWFIPIGNLYIPFEIMSELYQKTTKYLKNYNVKANLPYSIIVIWWTLMVLNFILN